MPRQKRATSKKITRRLTGLPAFDFAQVLQTTRTKVRGVGRRVKVPAKIQRLPLVRDLTPRTYALLGALVLAAVLLFFFGNNLVQAWQSKTAAAVVNGEVISKGDLNRRLIQSYGDDTVQKLVDETLVFQEAAKEKVQVTPDEVNAELAQVEASIAPTKLDDALAARKMDRADLDRQIRLKILIDKMLGSGINPSDKDIQTYFDANKDALAQSVGKSSADLKLDDVRSDIISTLKEQEISNRYQTWIQDLQSKAKIQTYVNP